MEKKFEFEANITKKTYFMEVPASLQMKSTFNTNIRYKDT